MAVVAVAPDKDREGKMLPVKNWSQLFTKDVFSPGEDIQGNFAPCRLAK